jgi:hypothetical protein
MKKAQKEKKREYKRQTCFKRLISFLTTMAHHTSDDEMNRLTVGSDMYYHTIACKYDKSLGVKFKLLLGFSQIQNAFYTILPVNYDNKNKDVENLSNIANVDLTVFTAISCITGKFFNQLLFLTLVSIIIVISCCCCNGKI